MLSELLTAVFPLSCPGCGRPGDPVCRSCAANLTPPALSAPPTGIDEWYAAFAYQGVARALVAGVKYRRAHAATAWLADAMARLVSPPVPPLVTWAPTTVARRRERGYDQAEILARSLARRIHRPCRSTLRRCDGPPQTGLSASARRDGPHFVARRGVQSSIVIVDDVATTGATLAAAAAELRRHGAQRVVALTAARTPPP